MSGPNMEDRKEKITEVAWEILDACNGFSVDIGGSVMKLVYIHKEDWLEPKDRNSTKGKLRLVNFAREELDLAYPYIKERTYIKRTGASDKPLVYTTGVGGELFFEDIESRLDVKPKNLTEMDCFIQTLRYALKNQTYAELVNPIEEPCKRGIKKRSDLITSMVAKMTSAPKDEAQTGMAMPTPDIINLDDSFCKTYAPDYKFTDDEELFPCLLVMCGSAGAVMKIENDGTFLTTEMMFRVGRHFFGLGCLLTGAKTFDELMSLAEKGNPKAVHNYIGDLTKDISKKESSIYSTMQVDDDEEDQPFFLFGKAVGKETSDFRREDLARALVVAMATDVAQIAHLVEAKFPVKHVFFCGNFVNHPVIRHEIALDYGFREAQTGIFLKKKIIRPHFLKDGAFFGAMGALLNNHLKFTDSMGEMSAKAKEHLQEEFKTKGNIAK